MSVKIERLPEDSEEAIYFREMVQGPLHGVHSALRIWALTHPFKEGSQAKVLAVMANVVAEAIEELDELRKVKKDGKLTEGEDDSTAGVEAEDGMATEGTSQGV